MRFHGNVGYGETVETTPGVWEDAIVERVTYGDVIRNSRKLTQGEVLNPGLSLGNAISIVADAYASAHYFQIRYVDWQGQKWTVTDVEIARPRLILNLGEVYNGPAGESPDTP